MRWEQGRATIEVLLNDGELERILPDVGVARSLLESARRHLESSAAIRERDPEGGYAALYDAARKACAALLEAQGLRATSRGGHVAVREAVVAQFGFVAAGGVLRSFDRLRRRRNDIEYPMGDSNIDAEEVDEALTRSRDIVRFAEQLVDELSAFS